VREVVGEIDEDEREPALFKTVRGMGYRLI